MRWEVPIMQSKTSYFSKTIFLKNITRFWPVWSAYLLICLVRLPLSLYTELNAKVTDVTDIAAYRITLLENAVQSALHPFYFFLFACITAIVVFSYLFQTRSANMIHALPVCRESLFLTNVLSGICFLVIPQLIAFLCSIFVCFIQQVTQLEYLLHWLILSIGMSVFAFALATFTIMITGNGIAVPIFYIIINYAFVGFRAMIEWFVQTLSYGVRSADFTFGTFLSPYYFLSTSYIGRYSEFYSSTTSAFTLPKLYAYIGGYFAAGIILLVLAFLLYKKKHLETTGDIVSLPFLRPVVRWGAALGLGSCLTLLGYEFFIDNHMAPSKPVIIWIFMAIGCIIAFFLADMLLQKSFFVFCKKRCLECGILVILSLVFVIGLEKDILGIESKIPKEADIASLFLYGSYPIEIGAEDFSQVLVLHQELIDSKTEFEDYFRKYSNNSNFTSVELSYTLKNGATMTRNYKIPLEDYYLEQEDYAFHLLDAISNDPEYYLRHHFTNAYESITFVEASLDVYNGTKYFDSIPLDQAQCNIVYEAFKQDVRLGNYHIYDYASSNLHEKELYYNSLYFTFQVPVGSSYTTFTGTELVQRSNTLQGTTINLTTDCVHTLNALKEIGVLDDLAQMITQEEANKLYADETYEEVEYH